MAPPPPSDLAASLDRTTARLIQDFVTAYHGGTARPTSWVTPGEFATAVASLRSAARRGCRTALDTSTRAALDLAGPAILSLVARWPAQMAADASAWELALILRQQGGAA